MLNAAFGSIFAFKEENNSFEDVKDRISFFSTLWKLYLDFKKKKGERKTVCVCVCVWKARNCISC